ncbi:hypothetical protein ACJ41O_007349 [Fusarium nematophilum]
MSTTDENGKVTKRCNIPWTKNYGEYEEAAKTSAITSPKHRTTASAPSRTKQRARISAPTATAATASRTPTKRMPTWLTATAPSTTLSAATLADAKYGI